MNKADAKIRRPHRDDAVESQPEIDHAPRSAWRAERWFQRLRNQGTKPSCLRALVLPWSFVETAFEATRKTLQNIPAHLRSWALRAASGHNTSQAAFDGVNRKNIIAPCWFCGVHAPATYQHVLWRCKGIALDPQIMIERDMRPLQAHLGWSIPAEDTRHNLAALKRHTIVCELLASKRREFTNGGGLTGALLPILRAL